MFEEMADKSAELANYSLESWIFGFKRKSRCKGWTQGRGIKSD
jgi:hypothetical protein